MRFNSVIHSLWSNHVHLQKHYRLTCSYYNKVTSYQQPFQTDELGRFLAYLGCVIQPPVWSSSTFRHSGSANPGLQSTRHDEMLLLAVRRWLSSISLLSHDPLCSHSVDQSPTTRNITSATTLSANRCWQWTRVCSVFAGFNGRVRHRWPWPATTPSGAAVWSSRCRPLVVSVISVGQVISGHLLQPDVIYCLHSVLCSARVRTRSASFHSVHGGPCRRSIAVSCKHPRLCWRPSAVCTLSSGRHDCCCIDRLERCLSDVCHWMSANRLKLNADKTELLWAGSRYAAAAVSWPISTSRGWNCWPEWSCSSPWRHFLIGPEPWQTRLQCHCDVFLLSSPAPESSTILGHQLRRSITPSSCHVWITAILCLPDHRST